MNPDTEKNRKRIKRGRFAASYLLFLFLAVFTVFSGWGVSFAEDGENNGANQDEPLVLVSSDPAYGAENVALRPTILLSFSKNVVNMAVKENNAGCFSMTDIQGTPVEIRIRFPDDQIEPAEKRNIYLTPVEPLAADTQYVVTVSGALIAKSGVPLDALTQIVFRTGHGEDTVQAASSDSSASENTARSAASAQETDPLSAEKETFSEEESTSTKAIGDNPTNEAVSARSENTEKTSEKNGGAENGGLYIPIGAAILVLLLSGGLIVFRIRRKGTG